MHIRKIQPADNTSIEKIIKSVFIEFELAKVGTAYEDIETTRMFESYQGKKEVYFVIEVNGQVLGGGGIKHLKNADKNICELQKMYFSPQIRGKGYGKIMFQTCIAEAKKFGYKQCYLESATELKAAIHLYQKNKFNHLDGPLGGTGHYSCGVWMIKDL